MAWRSHVVWVWFAAMSIPILSVTWGQSINTTGMLNTSALPCKKIYNFTVAVSSRFSGDSIALAAMIMADMEIRKWTEPLIQNRFGPINYPFPDRNPCFNLRPLALDAGADNDDMEDENAMWNAVSVANGWNGYPKAHAILSSHDFQSEVKLATYLAVQRIPHLSFVSTPEVSNKRRYPYTFRATSSDAIMSEIAMWYIQHYKFRTATVIYDVDAYGQSLFTDFMARARVAQYSNRVFAFPFASGVSPRELVGVAADLCSRAKLVPTRLIVIFTAFYPTNFLYDALRAEGLWMPKYQLFSSFSHLASTLYRTPDGIRESVKTPVHYTLNVAEASPSVNSFGWFGMFGAIGMDTVQEVTPRYMLDNFNPAVPPWNVSLMDPGFFSSRLDGVQFVIMSSTGNQLMFVAHAISHLMNTIDPDTIDTPKILEQMKHTKLPAIGDAIYEYDKNQDLVALWGAFHTCENCDNGQGDASASGLPNIFTVPFLSGSAGQFAAIRPTRWANGEESYVAPAELTECQPGQSITPSGTCTMCQVGWVSTEINQSACVACEAGKFAEANGTMCTSCAPGRGSAESGMTACLICPKGFASLGGANCETCEAGTYADQAEMSICKSCESILAGGSSLRTAKSPSECVCPEGRYREGGINGSCVDCPQQMFCKMGSDMDIYFSMRDQGFPDNDTELYPTLEKRHWSSTDTPLSVFLCNSDAACPGGIPGTCGPAFEGQSCGACVKDYCLTDDGECRLCSSRLASWMLFLLVPLLLSPFVISGLYFFFRDMPAKWESPQNLMAALMLLVLSHYQTIGIIGAANVEWPPKADSVFSSFSWTNDIMSVLNIGCIGISGFTSIYLLKILLPFLCLFLVLLTYSASWICSKLCVNGVGMERDRTVNLYMSVVYTFFAAIASSSMLLFKFKKSPNDEYALAADASVLQSSDSWKSAFALGIFALLVECLGVVVLFLYVICQAPRQFHKEAFQKRWKFLFIKYRPDVYWWGVPHIIRGVVVNLCLVVLVKGCRQLYWIYFAMLTYASLVILFRPWRNGPTNGLDILGSLAVASVAVLSTWFGVEEELTSDVEIVTVAISFGAGLLWLSAVCILVVPQFMREKITGLGRKYRRRLEADKDFFINACKMMTLLDEKESDAFFVEYLQHYDRTLMSHVANCIMHEFHIYESRQRLCRADYKKKGTSLSNSSDFQRTGTSPEKDMDNFVVEQRVEIEITQAEKRMETKLVNDEMQDLDWPYELTPRVSGWWCTYAQQSPQSEGVRTVFSPRITPRTARTPPRCVTPTSPQKAATPQTLSTPPSAGVPAPLTPTGDPTDKRNFTPRT